MQVVEFSAENVDVVVLQEPRPDSQIPSFYKISKNDSVFRSPGPPIPSEVGHLFRAMWATGDNNFKNT